MKRFLLIILFLIPYSYLSQVVLKDTMDRITQKIYIDDKGDTNTRVIYIYKDDILIRREWYFRSKLISTVIDN